jgi:hypothetical protein
VCVGGGVCHEGGGGGEGPVAELWCQGDRPPSPLSRAPVLPAPPVKEDARAIDIYQQPFMLTS